MTAREAKRRACAKASGVILAYLSEGGSYGEFLEGDRDYSEADALRIDDALQDLVDELGRRSVGAVE